MRYSTFSNIFVVVYLLGTLYFRMLVEPQLHGHYLISLGLGAFALLFLWVLIKSRLIRPTLLQMMNGK